jgi:quercetin dioxygenase-like cupin family protein
MKWNLQLNISPSAKQTQTITLSSKQPNMSQPQIKLLENGLPNINRYITTTNSSGKAILSEAISPTSIWQKIGSMATFFLGYTTRTFPVSLSSSDDLSSYNNDFSSPPGLTVSNGTVLRYVDMAPNTTSPMHKTASLDYGIVLEGEIELVLDSGETKLMRRGDSCIQRGTNHAWRNVTPNGGWGRMVYVLVAAQGEGLVEELNGMPDVKDSN